MEAPMFLNENELVTLTGRKIKSLQIDALRKMGMPFWVNAGGRPVVARATIEGKKTEPPVESEWVPAVLKG